MNRAIFLRCLIVILILICLVLVIVSIRYFPADIRVRMGENRAIFNENGPKMLGKIAGGVKSRKLGLPWCIGPDRSKPENLVYFDGLEEGLEKGFTKAKRCIPD